MSEYMFRAVVPGKDPKLFPSWEKAEGRRIRICAVPYGARRRPTRGPAIVGRHS